MNLIKWSVSKANNQEISVIVIKSRRTRNISVICLKAAYQMQQKLIVCVQILFCLQIVSVYSRGETFKWSDNYGSQTHNLNESTIAEDILGFLRAISNFGITWIEWIAAFPLQSSL